MYTKEINGSTASVQKHGDIVIVNFDDRELYFEWYDPLDGTMAAKIFTYLETCIGNPENYDATLIMVHLFS